MTIDAAARIDSAAARTGLLFSSGSGRVAQRLMGQVSIPIPHQMPQQAPTSDRRPTMSRPDTQAASSGESPADLHRTSTHRPWSNPRLRVQTMLRRSPDRAAACELDVEYLFFGPPSKPRSDRGTDHAVRCIDSPNLRRGPNEVGDGNTAPIREANERVARDALAQIGHNRLFVVPLLDAAIQLRQRDDGDNSTPWRAPSGRGRSPQISVARFSLLPGTCMSCR